MTQPPGRPEDAATDAPQETTAAEPASPEDGQAREAGHPPAGEPEVRRPDLDVRYVRSNNGRVIAVLGLLVVVLVAFVVARPGLGRWWTGKVADACDGQFSVAVPLGFGLGLACTAIAMLAMREVFRRTRSWTPSFVLAVVALVFASPLVITLLTVLSNSATAQAASEKLADQAPGFTPSVLLGAIAGATLVCGFWWLSRSRRRLLAEITDLRQRLAVLEAVATEMQSSGRHTKVTPAEPTAEPTAEPAGPTPS